MLAVVGVLITLTGIVVGTGYRGYVLLEKQAADNGTAIADFKTETSDSFNKLDESIGNLKTRYQDEDRDQRDRLKRLETIHEIEDE